MADNLGITPGIGALARTDQGAGSGAHMQVVKLAVSADGAEELIPADVPNGMDVDVTRSALPAGAATEGTLGGIKTGTDKIPASPSQEHATAVSPASARLSDGSAFYKGTTPSDTQPVSAAALPLPTGAAAEATLAGVKIGTDKIPASPAQEHSTAVSPASARLSDGSAFYNAPVAAQLPAGLVGGRLSVDGSGVTQPVSGTVTAKSVDENGAAFSDTNPLPVEIVGLGRTRVRKAVTYSASQTAVAIWTPAGSKRYVMTHLIITPTTAGALLKIFDNTDAAGNMIYQGQPPLGSFVIPFPHLCPSAAINNVLRYSTGAGAGGDITTEGYEV